MKARQDPGQLELSDGYKEAQRRVDLAFTQVSHLLHHVSNGNQEATEYWSSAVRRTLVRLSMDLEEWQKIWRQGG